MILTRYILKEHIGPFLFSVLMIVFVFLLNIIFRDLGRILSRGIDFFTILEFLFLNLAWMIALAVPMGVLIATLTTFGRLSADNEMTAMKASGISFYRLLVPVLSASFVIMIALIVYNNEVLPHFNHRARLLMEDIFRKRPTLKLEPNVVFNDIPNMNLLTKKIIEKGDSSRLEYITIDDMSNKRVRRTIFAEWGKLKFDKRADRLFLDLFNGEIHEINKADLSKYRKLRFERYRMSVDIPGLSLKRSESQYRGDREKSVAMMQDDIKKHRTSIRQRRKRISQLIERYLSEAFDLTLIEQAEKRSPESIFFTLPFKPTPREVQILHRKLQNMKNQIEVERRIMKSHSISIDKLRVEIHKKYSIPVACVVFVLIGAPLGVLTRKGNMFVAAAVSFLFYLLYWVFLIGGEQLGDRQIISPVWGMWAPNILVGSFAIYLVISTVREYRPIQWERLRSKLMRRHRYSEKSSQEDS